MGQTTRRREALIFSPTLVGKGLRVRSQYAWVKGYWQQFLVFETRFIAVYTSVFDLSELYCDITEHFFLV
jgi:hypothetical protein